MADDLHIELAQAVQRGRRDGDAAWLERRRVRCCLVGADRVKRHDAGFYEPDPAGFRAFIFAVLARSHVCEAHSLAAVTPRDIAGGAVPLLDLAAWRPSDAGVILLRRGVVTGLGEWNLYPSLASDGDVLRLWASPLAWAAANFSGAVVIDWRDAAPSLLAWPTIECETLALGELLDGELRKARRRIVPRLPKINVLAA
jgi:hypothetical protein